MKIENLIKENPGINLTVEARDLLEFGHTIATQTAKEILEKYSEKLNTRNETIERFKISSTTLWRWDKLGLIQSKKIGNRIFYPESSIKKLISQKGV
jgi:ribosomal protein S17E